MNTTSITRSARFALAAIVMLVIAAPALAQPTITFTGKLGSGSPEYPFTTGSLTGRLNRFLPGSTCGTADACPGYFTTADARTYDAYRFTNCSSSAICMQFDLSSPCSGNDYLFGVAYLSTFNPSDLCANYLGDCGGSPSPTASFSVDVPAGSTVVLVVHNVTPGYGASCSYDVTVSGFPAGSAVATSPTTPTVLTPASGSMVTIPFDFGCSIRAGEFVSASSSDPDAGTFSGDQAGDIQNAVPGATSVDVRAERSPGNDGRIYTLSFTNDRMYVVVPKQTGSYVPGGSGPCNATLAASALTLSSTSIDIPFFLEMSSNVTIGIRTLSGKEIARIVTDAPFGPGTSSVTWDGTSTYGRNPGANVPNGTYVVVLQSCGITSARPITVAR
jgi:hypothetical protein